MIKEKLLREMLVEQMKTNEILAYLKSKGIVMSDREWRRFVRKYNELYGTRERYIASDNHGYYLTTSKKNITRTAMNKLKVGLSMVKNAKADLKELANKNQLSLLDEDVEIYDLIMKLKEV